MGWIRVTRLEWESARRGVPPACEGGSGVEGWRGTFHKEGTECPRTGRSRVRPERGAGAGGRVGCEVVRRAGPRRRGGWAAPWKAGCIYPN